MPTTSNGRAAELSRAPANPMQALVTLATGDPCDAVMVARALARAVRRRRWRTLMARRGGLVSGSLRRLRRDLSYRYAGCCKQGGTWQVLAFDGADRVVAAEVRMPRVAIEDDFALPFQVEVLRADLLVQPWQWS